MIENFAFPGGTVQKISLNKQYLPVRKGFSLKISYRAAFSLQECFSLEIVVILESRGDSMNWDFNEMANSLFYGIRSMKNLTLKPVILDLIFLHKESSNF